MPLSSVLGAQSLVRPGVCTSSTRPASPFEGQVIYETDTNQVLVYSGTAWVMIGDVDTPPGLQLIKTQTIGSAVSSVTVSDVFSAEFDNYKIMICDGVSSTTQGIALQLGASTTGYYGGLTLTAYNGGAVSGTGDNNQSSFRYVGVGSANTNHMDATVNGPFLAKRTTISSLYSVPATGQSGGSYAGFHDVATSYTAFTVSVGGTMTGGTIRVYGYRNS
jgi:hypothetical protein